MGVGAGLYMHYVVVKMFMFAILCLKIRNCANIVDPVEDIMV